MILRSSCTVPVRSSVFVPLILTLVMAACTPAATTRAVHSPSTPQLATSHVPGIPDQPDVVTVVPFVPKRHFTAADSADLSLLQLKQTVVPIMAEVDGHRGLYILDLGAPFVALTPEYFRLSPTGGVDTATVVDHSQKGFVHVQLRIGTLLDQFDDPTLPRSSSGPTNALLIDQGINLDCCVDGPAVGNLGLSALEPFETIIDYTHQRVVFIRVDSVGHRLVSVPAYTPTWSTPLIDLRRGGPNHYWGVAVRPDGRLDTLNLRNNTVTRMMDTGNPNDDENSLGYPFLSHFGVIGFNHRTHQILLYRT